MADIQHEDLTSVHRGSHVSSSDPGAVGAYHFWTDTTTTPHILKVRNAGNSAWVQVGYITTGSNVGASGEGVFKQAVGQDLEFKKIKATNSSILVTSDASNVNIAVGEAGLTLANLSGNLPSTRISLTTAAALVGKPTVGAGPAVNIELGAGLEFDGTTLRVTGVSGFVTLSGTETLTNKTISLGSNTITTTVAQLNTAITDGNIIPEAGGVFTGAIEVPGDPYGVSWDTSDEVPTKGDIYTEIESFKTGETYTVTNVTPDRSYDATATSDAEIAQVLGTLIADLQAAGIID